MLLNDAFDTRNESLIDKPDAKLKAVMEMRLHVLGKVDRHGISVLVVSQIVRRCMCHKCVILKTYNP